MKKIIFYRLIILATSVYILGLLTIILLFNPIKIKIFLHIPSDQSFTIIGYTNVNMSKDTIHFNVHLKKTDSILLIKQLSNRAGKKIHSFALHCEKTDPYLIKKFVFCFNSGCNYTIPISLLKKMTRDQRSLVIIKTNKQTLKIFPKNQTNNGLHFKFLFRQYLIWLLTFYYLILIFALLLIRLLKPNIGLFFWSFNEIFIFTIISLTFISFFLSGNLHIIFSGLLLFLLVIWIIKNKPNFNLQLPFPVIIFSSYFLLKLLPAFFHNKPDCFFNSLILYIPFFAIPFLNYFGKPLNIHPKNLKITLSFITLLFTLAGLALYLINYFFYHPTLKDIFDFSDSFNEMANSLSLMLLHPTYLGYILIISLIFFRSDFSALEPKPLQIIYYIQIVSTFLLLLIMDSKSGLYALFFVIATMYTFNIKKLRRPFTLLIVLSLFFIYWLLVGYYVKHFDHTRMQLWLSGWHEIKNNWLTGYGLCSEKAFLSSLINPIDNTYCYSYLNNFHNQFITEWFSYGIILFIYFIIALVLIIRSVWLKYQNENFIFLLTTIIFLLTENLFNRARGILLFTFVMVILANNIFLNNQINNYNNTIE